MLGYVWYLMGYEEKEIEPDPRTVRIRHEMMKQIRLSHGRMLRPILERTPNMDIPGNTPRVTPEPSPESSPRTPRLVVYPLDKYPEHIRKMLNK
jgi:hypothetical protein